jgi:molybdate transport system substrate-binding protein
MNHNSFRFGNFFARSHYQRGCVAGNHPSVVTGQALPCPRSAQGHVEAKVWARYGLPTTNRILFIAALSRRISARLSAIGIAAFCSIHAAGAVELKVLSGGAMRAALQELARIFENTSGHKLLIEYGVVAKVVEQVAGGDPVDVAILTRPLFEKLVGIGKLVGGTEAPLAHVPIGLAVKASAPRPDIRTVAAWQKAVLNANIVTYGDPVMGDAAGVHVAHVLQTLGLAEVLRPKTRLISPSPGQSGAQYLTGLFQRRETEIAMAPISVLSETQGVDIVGLLPAELQSPDLVFLAAMPLTCRHPAEAKALIDFLADAPAKAVYHAKGMEPS